MKIRYITVLLFVKDIQASRAFYETTLQQKVKFDFGEDIEFEGGLAIHDAGHISKLLFNRTSNEELGKNNFEVYFECDDLDAVFSRLEGQAARFLHGIEEQPWGQRAFRVYDPDGHIVEIGEPMAVTIKRYLAQGMPASEIARKTSMPLEEITRIKAEPGNSPE